MRAAALLLLAALGCADRDAQPALAARDVRCLAAAAGAPTHYEPAGSWGDEGLGLERLGGIAVSGGRVYLFDPAHPRVVVLDTALQGGSAFGRKGEGPGEFRGWRIQPRLGGGSWRWLTILGDTVQVFDSGRISLFTPDGEYLDAPAAAGADAVVGTLNARVLRLPGGTLHGSGGYDVGRFSDVRKPVLRMQLVGAGTTRDVATMELEPWPLTKDGVPFGHPVQARPLWDAAGDCLYLSDGSSGRVRIIEISTGAENEVHVDLPNNSPEMDEEAIRSVLSSLGHHSSVPKPSLMMRLNDLIIDPDQRLWLRVRGATPRSPIQAIRIHRGGSELVDLPAFPRAFGANGEFYGAETDSLDVIRITRYRPAGVGRATLLP